MITYNCLGCKNLIGYNSDYAINPSLFLDDETSSIIEAHYCKAFPHGIPSNIDILTDRFKLKCNNNYGFKEK